MITITGYKNSIQATEEDIHSICDNCCNSDSYCNEDLNIKDGFMHCSKLSFNLQNKNGGEVSNEKTKVY